MTPSEAATHLLAQLLPAPAPAEFIARLAPNLAAGHDEDGDRSYRGLRTAPDLHHELASLAAPPSALSPLPSLLPSLWPRNAPFALFLSHDIDQIYDRELFRVLADINHVRRILTQGETGNARLACRRIARALYRPKRTLLDFETILELEGRHGFRSTFFLLHDRYWARQGARFSFQDREIRQIGQMALAAGCELGVHGGYYRFNHAAAYRESRQAVQDVFGVDPVGIRNHLLRFSYPDTWRAQAEAGFAYDATYGYGSVPGPRSGLAFPFFVPSGARNQESGIRNQGPATRAPQLAIGNSYSTPSSILHLPSSTPSAVVSESAGHSQSATGNRQLDLLELPLLLMDTSLFRYLRLEGDAALEFAWNLIERMARQGALVSLLWHNNFFNEPEYWDWQMVYEKLLERLAALRPWCAPGAEINRWWRARAALTIQPLPGANGPRGWRIHAPLEIRDLCLLLRPAAPTYRVQVDHPAARLHYAASQLEIHFPDLAANSAVQIAAFPAVPAAAGLLLTAN